MAGGMNILAVGGAHIDRRGQVTGAFVPGASNPGTMREDVGGGVFNALRNAVLRGVSGSLMSLRGGDAAGDTVARAIALAGIGDQSAIFLDRRTPSYTALLASDGDVIAAVADMALYDIAFAKQMRRSKLRELIAACDAIFCDANLPGPALQSLVALGGGKPVFAVAISPAKVVRFAGLLPALSCLFMNSREAAALAGFSAGTSAIDSARLLRQRGLTRAVITEGGAPVVGFDPDGGTIALPPPPVERIADVTGAGDALAGAMTAALMRGLAFGQALREGMAAAHLALASPNAAPDFTQAEFAAALEKIGEAVETA